MPAILPEVCRDAANDAMPAPLLGFFAASGTCFAGRGKSGGPPEFLRPEPSDAKMDLLPAPIHIQPESFSLSAVSDPKDMTDTATADQLAAFQPTEQTASQLVSVSSIQPAQRYVKSDSRVTYLIRASVNQQIRGTGHCLYCCSQDTGRHILKAQSFGLYTLFS